MQQRRQDRVSQEILAQIHHDYGQQQIATPECPRYSTSQRGDIGGNHIEKLEAIILYLHSALQESPSIASHIELSKSPPTKNRLLNKPGARASSHPPLEYQLSFPPNPSREQKLYLLQITSNRRRLRTSQSPDHWPLNSEIPTQNLGGISATAKPSRTSGRRPFQGMALSLCAHTGP